MLKESGKRWVGWLMVTLLVAALSYGVGVWSAPVTSFGIDGSGNLDVNGVESNTLRVAALTSGRIPIAGTNGLIGDDTDLRWVGGDTLTVANISATSNYVTTAYILGLTAGRIPLIGAGGLVGTDSDLTFSGDTLTSTKIFTGQLNATEIYRNGQTLAEYILATAPGTTMLTQASPYTYIVSVVTGTYYANSTTGGTNYSSASFVTLWGSVVGALADGDSVFFKSGVYPYATVLDFGGHDNVSFVGEKGAILQCSNAIATAGIRFIGTSEDDHDQTLTVRGLTFDNNLLTSGPFFKWSDHLVIEDCHIYDTVNATLRSSIVITSTTLHPNVDVRILNNHVEFAGGSGISVSYTNSLNIRGNYIHDACQFDYPAGGGIQTNLETSWVTITGNVVSGTTKNDGMYLGESTQVGTATNYIHYTVTGNTIILNDLHISATSGIKGYLNEAVITGNTIGIAGTSDGSVGIHITGLHNIVSSNVIKCAGIAWAGIYMDDTVTTGRSMIIGNIISGTDTMGIENEQDYNYFADNDITCPTGIHHIVGADQNNVIGGTFEGCTTEVSDSGTGNTLHNYIDKAGAYQSG